MKGLAALFAMSASVLALAGTSGAGGQPSASGNGSIFAGSQSFNFGARGVDFGADGHITYIQRASDPDTVFKGRINCLRIINNQAYMSGNIVSISPAQNPATAPTDFFAFGEDNGEPGDFRDRFTFFALTPTPTFDPTCINPLSTTGSVINEGNVDVNPVP